MNTLPSGALLKFVGAIIFKAIERSKTVYMSDNLLLFQKKGALIAYGTGKKKPLADRIFSTELC